MLISKTQSLTVTLRTGQICEKRERLFSGLPEARPFTRTQTAPIDLFGAASKLVANRESETGSGREPTLKNRIENRDEKSCKSHCVRPCWWNVWIPNRLPAVNPGAEPSYDCATGDCGGQNLVIDGAVEADQRSRTRRNVNAVISGSPDRVVVVSILVIWAWRPHSQASTMLLVPSLVGEVDDEGYFAYRIQQRRCGSPCGLSEHIVMPSVESTRWIARVHQLRVARLEEQIT